MKHRRHNNVIVEILVEHYGDIYLQEMVCHNYNEEQPDGSFKFVASSKDYKEVVDTGCNIFNNLHNGRFHLVSFYFADCMVWDYTLWDDLRCYRFRITDVERKSMLKDWAERAERMGIPYRDILRVTGG